MSSVTVVTVFFFVQCIIKQFSIRFGFCDIQNNQDLGKDYQPQLSASADNPLTSTLIIPDITKTESNNCLFSHAGCIYSLLSRHLDDINEEIY